MKKIKYLLFIIAFVSAFVSCEKIPVDIGETDVDNTANPVYTISVVATKGEDGTKALSLDGNVLNASWNEGDVVTVTKDGTSVGTLTAQYSGAATILKGTLANTIVEGDNLTLSYLSASYFSQDGSLEYIAANCDYAIATVSVSAVVDGEVTTDKAVFKNQQAITEFTFTVGGSPVEVSNLKIYFMAYEEMFVTPSEPKSKFYVALSANWNTSRIYYFAAEVNGQVLFGEKKVSLVNGSFYKTSVALSEPSYPTPESVDMGLSVKWASMNLGASIPQEIGYLYAWGETDPKFDYTVQNYSLCDGVEGLNHDISRLLKYNKSSSLGPVDNRTQLVDSDDAVKVHLGGAWRMPTSSEIDELINNCTWTRVSYGPPTSVKGYRVTSNLTGQSIFIPINLDLNNGTPYLGHYWSSSLEVDSAIQNASQFAYALELDYLDHHSQYFEGIELRKVGGSRERPASIRPVCVINPISVTSIYLDKTAVSLYKGDLVSLSATVSPSNATNRVVIWTSSDENVATVNQEGQVVAVGGGVATITAKTLDKGYTATCSVEVTELDIFTPEIVDLGLSVKWTSFNIGASKPEEYGYYFAWGEIAPKTTYYESNYKWQKYVSSWQLTKYCKQESNGIVDNKTRLEPEDDVAYVNLAPMRMPTYSEWTELKNNCTWAKATINGVDGVKITSNKPGYTDKWIFLPAAGYKYETYTQYNGSICENWSSEISSSDSWNASYGFFRLRDSFKNVGSQYRRYGLPVRAVIEAASYTPVTSVTLDKERIMLSAGSTETLVATIVPTNATFKDITWSSSNPAVATVDASGNINAIAEGVAVITASTPDVQVSCTVGVDMVDLGLPSGTLWSMHNLGASSMYDGGDFYAWGETEPKESFTRDNYKWYDSNYKATKYCVNANHGTVDNKTALDLEDDAAYVQSGGRLRMPTSAEFEELIDNCNWTWNSSRGGWNVRGKASGYTQNYIFLRAAGYGDGSGVGTSGGYYSSSLNANPNIDQPSTLSITSSNQSTLWSSRYSGRSIRPVAY